MQASSNIFRRYLPRDRDADEWGWRLIDSGNQRCGPGEAYPPEGHPEAYLFDRDGGRVLGEYQIVVLTRGQGRFASASCPETAVRAGDAFLLFPGEWHCYRPDTETGWAETWAGFDGTEARRVMADFFPRDRPVFPQAGDADLLATFVRQFDILREPRPGCEELAASLIPHQLALLRFSRLAHEGPRTKRREWVMLAKHAMLENPAERTDFEALAASFHLPYARFRKLFKAETGHAPRAFENALKLNRARDLLRSGRHNVNTVSDQLGYSSVYYFSRAYKKHHGHPPSQDLGT